jgi:hypothetical protein
MTEPKTLTLDLPGASLRYDVRDAESAEPVLLMIGYPMAASGSPAWRSTFVTGRS